METITVENKTYTVIEKLTMKDLKKNNYLGMIEKFNNNGYMACYFVKDEEETYHIYQYFSGKFNPDIE